MDLKLGNKGAEVLALQRELNKLGYKLTEDGSFGFNTRDAIVNFQKSKGISQTGVASTELVKKIQEASKVKNNKKYQYFNPSKGFHYVEVNPLDLRLVHEQNYGTHINLPNMINGSFVWWTDIKKTKAYPTSVTVFDGKIIRNSQPNGYEYQGKQPFYINGVPTPVFIIYKDGTVEVKKKNSFTQEEADKIHLAVTGIQLTPFFLEDGFSPYVSFPTVGYSTDRIAIGYNPITKKIILAFKKKTSAKEMAIVMAKLGCTSSVSLDSGGSANFDVENKKINRTSRAMCIWLTW